MTDIVPVPNWGGVRQLETNEYATGGLNGNMNEQAKSLAGQNMYSRLYAGLPFDPVFTAQVGGFPIGGRAALENGYIVRSTVANNTVDPNIDMTGWRFANDVVNSIAELLAIQNPKAGDVVFVKGYYPVTNFALAKPYKGGGDRVYVSSLSSRNDGGVCINGWVLLDTSDLNVYHFGAYGDWNATAQTGHDDSLAFQNYANYLMTYENNPREGGSRIMRVLAGNYRLDGFTITQGSAYWSFNLVGEGQLSQLWFNPTGQGIILENENTVFQDIFLNGKLSPVYPTTENPAIPSIVTAKLANKLLDVDFVAKNCSVSWFNTFATVSGRGFTFQNGMVGMGQTLFRINLTNDLVISGSEPKIHSIESALRHFNVSNNRFDVVDRIFEVTGDTDSPLKSYINGLTIANNELTLVAHVGRTTNLAGTILVAPSFLDNTCIGCFGNQVVHDYGGIKNGLDDGNSYFNYINGSVADEDMIDRLYRLDSLDGLTIVNCRAKDIRHSIVFSQSVKNLKILDSTFDNIFDGASGLKSILYCDSNPSHIKIKGNTFNSIKSDQKSFIASSVSSSVLNSNTTIEITGNTLSSGFTSQDRQPQLGVIVNGVPVSGSDFSARKCSFVTNGDYVEMTFSANILNISATSGNIRISLPVPAIADNIALSSYYSGGGFVGQAAGLIGTNNIQLQVSASTDQCIKLMSGNSEFNLSAKTSNSVVLAGVVKYRFK